MGLTSWRSLKSDGTILDTPAVCFRYKYAQDFWLSFGDTTTQLASVLVALLGPGIPAPVTGITTFTFGGTFEIHIEDPGGNKIFEQSVTLTYRIVALLEAFVGLIMVSLFTWWIEEEEIETTICGHVLEEGEQPAIYAGVEEGFSQPAGGSDYTDYEGHILTDWTSPLYALNIPAGSKFFIDFHNIGMVGLTKLGVIQTQVCAGGICAALRSPEHGMLWVARAEADAIDITGTSDLRAIDPGMNADTFWPWDEGAPNLGAPIHGAVDAQGATRPVLLRFPCKAHLVLVWQGGQNIQVSRSITSGQQTELVQWSTPMNVLPGHTLLGAAISEDGSALYLVARGSQGTVSARCPVEYDEGELVIGEGEPVLMTLEDDEEFPSIADQLHTLQMSGQMAMLIVDGGAGVEVYLSHDGLRTWRR